MLQETYENWNEHELQVLLAQFTELLLLYIASNYTRIYDPKRDLREMKQRLSM
jgi:hypothetical protein